MWTFTARTARNRTTTHTAPSREKARKLRSAVSRLPFVVDTTTPTKRAA